MAELKTFDLFRIPGDERPGRVWVVEHVGPCSATVRPYTKKAVSWTTLQGEEVSYEAMDGKRMTIAVNSAVEVIGQDEDLPVPRWLRRSRKASKKTLDT